MSLRQYLLPCCLSLFSVSLAILLSPSPARAHAEHDKPRYVAVSGRDEGRCDTPPNACETIGYAAQQASKGDVILVAEGRYTLADINQLFHLISGVVPVKGGHSARDFKADPERYPTFIHGVPPEYAEALTERGFQVIVDNKGLDGKRQRKLQSKLSLVDTLKKAHANEPCDNGQADDFPCHRIDLVAHLPLSTLDSTEGNDIWGHIDLNDGREYALMGLRNGTAIVDVSNPETPRLVTRIPGQRTTWRDIKVLQRWSESEQRWRAWAYVTADAASIGLQIIDLGGLPENAALVATDTTDLSAHNVYLSNVDYSTGIPLTGLEPYLHIAGSNLYGGAFNTYSLENPAAPERLYRHEGASRANYSHDVSSLVIEDERKDTQCLTSGSHCEIMLDYNENDVRLWDKTDNSNPAELSRTSYPLASYVHSGWWTEDKQFMTVHDELDEQRHSLKTTVHFFDISDLRDPLLAGTYTGPTAAIDHNGFTRGNRYYMSNYERGLTILDITDPTTPTEAGFFDTFPIGNNASFNGAWGVYPYLPSGLILVSDINSGLYILRDRTLSTAQGSLSFSAPELLTQEGTSLTIEVTRSGGTAGAISAGFETQAGAANSDDFTMTRGRLHWTNGEGGSKTFSVDIANDEIEEVDELFLVRLFDPQGGATLSAPNLATITIEGVANSGVLSFTASSLSARENSDQVEFDVTRQGGAEGAVQAEIVYSAEAPFTLQPHTLHWADGETGTQTVTLSPIYDPETTGDKDFTLTLASNSAVDQDQLNLTLRDEQSNLPPLIDGELNASVTTGEQVLLTVNASDPEGFDLTREWQQTAGESVDIIDADTPEAYFNAPEEAGTLSLTLTVTDDFGASAKREFEIAVTAPAAPAPTPPANNNNSSGGGGGALGLWFLLLSLSGWFRPIITNRERNA